MKSVSHHLLLFIFLTWNLNFIAQNIFIQNGAGVYDHDGNYYGSVQLNNGQEWISSNLRTTHFSDGSPIAFCPSSSLWLNATEASYANYNNVSSVDPVSGLLYNYYTTIHPRNVCPSGWRVPNQNDWTALTDALNGLGVAGGKLKSAGIDSWLSPNTDATNEIGFNAMPNGCRYDGGNFNNIGSYAFFWTSSELDSVYAWYRSLKYNTGNATRSFSKKQSGYAIRCMRDIVVGENEFQAIPVRVFPNPTSENIYWSIPETPGSIGTIRILDLNGREIEKGSLTNHSINISHLPKGIYQFVLQTENQIYRTKFIKD
jgi:uncharacterized protein (TIGR02145 family)